MKNISRNEIADFIYEKFGLAKKDCFDIVNDIFEEIILGIIKDKKVKIHNFGTFKLKSKKQRIGRNPKTKENFIISSRNVTTFSISKNTLDILNKKDDGKRI